MESYNALIQKVELKFWDDFQQNPLHLAVTIKYEKGFQDFNIPLKEHIKIETFFILCDVLSYNNLPLKPLRIKLDRGIICSVGHFIDENWIEI